MPASRLLFVLKHRDSPWETDDCPYHGPYYLSSGLRNSVRFIIELLELLGIPAKMVELANNNLIQAEIVAFKPTHVIIEALWVVPTKLDLLKKLNPTVHWALRLHSELPFLANEGIAMEWVLGYLQRGVEIMANAPRAQADLANIAAAFGYGALVSYAPNYYPVHCATHYRHLQPHPVRADDTIRIGCFGAIRPLKNQLAQAAAALAYAAAIGKKLEFYINVSRVEGGGNPILKNLRGMFAGAPRAQLVEQGWLDHPEFIELLYQIDICMQVSFSETFNIVTADAIKCSVPVVASKEVFWLKDYAVAEPTSVPGMVQRLTDISRQPRPARLAWQWRDLTAYSMASCNVWWHRFGRGGAVPIALK